MGPELLVIGAAAALGASQSRSQEKLELATIEANREEAKLAAAEQALSNAQGFRRALSSQLALASFRGGPGSSLPAQFGAASMESFIQDQKSIERGVKQIDTSSVISTAGARLGRSARDLKIATDLGSSLFGMANLSSSSTGN